MGWLDSLIRDSGLFVPPIPPELGRIAGMTGVADIVKAAVSTAYIAGVRDGLTASVLVFVVLLVVLARRK